MFKETFGISPTIAGLFKVNPCKSLQSLRFRDTHNWLPFSFFQTQKEYDSLG